MTLLQTEPNRRPTTLILAPHVDDELIGCSSLLYPREGREQREVIVIYFQEFTYERAAEAVQASKTLGFTAYPPQLEETVREIAGRCDFVCVPSRRDHHPAHKAVNAKYRSIATHFYSVDMEGSRPLSLAAAGEKRHYLNSLYPSQAALWENDHKYWLFEDIQEQDFDTYVAVDVGWAQVSCLEEYKDKVEAALHEYGNLTHTHDHGLKHLFSTVILPLCLRGEVTLTDAKTNVVHKS